MKTDIVQSINYNQAPDTVRREIAGLLHRVWPNACPMSNEKIPEAHDQELNAHSFYTYIDGKLVS